MSEEAIALKNLGNTAFQAKDYETAIKHFSEGIAKDPSYHVLHSNLSACYAAKGEYEKALSSAEQTIKLKPDWSRGYSRKGAALMFLHRYGEAAEAYEKGVEVDPTNQSLAEDFRNAQQQAMAQSQMQMAQMFAPMFMNPEATTALKSSPETRELMEQPDFVKIIDAIKQNPMSLASYMNDERVMKAVSVLLSEAQKARAGSQQQQQPSSSSSSSQTESRKKEEESKPEPMDERSDEQKAADDEKALGNAEFKKKNWEAAIEHYEKASELYPANILYRTNAAAALYQMKKYEECVKLCEKALEEGREHRAEYTSIAKAYLRMGHAYVALEKYDEAIHAFDKSLTEHRAAPALNAKNKAEKLKREAAARAYEDPEKALEAKKRGNDLFSKGDFPGAIKEYAEAIKRDPTQAAFYCNRAACLIKLGAYPDAIRDCDETLKRDPTFSKAYIRKAQSHFWMKEYNKCMNVYKAGVEALPDDPLIPEAHRETMALLRKRQAQGVDPEAQARALEDPEIKSIWTDPAFQQILQDINKGGEAAREHLQDPRVAESLNKLAIAGLIQLG